MNRKRRLFVLFAFVFLCMWFGFQAGTLAKGDEKARLAAYLGNHTSPYHKPLALAQSSSDEIRLLIVGVDQLSTVENSRLRSVWIAVNHPSQSNLVWYAYYPAIGPDSEETNRNIEGHFHVEAGQKIGLEFQTFLQTREKTRWNGAILLDDEGIGQLVDMLEVIKLQGQAINSRQALVGLKVAAEDPRMARMFQSELIRGFCERRDELGGVAKGVTDGVDFMMQRLSSPPPGIWDEALGSPVQISERLQRIFLTKQFLPCDISEF